MPVSWYAIERGWRVTTLDGVSLGTVDEVQGDEELDIFHGLSVRVGIGRLPREVPSDLVSAIEPARHRGDPLGRDRHASERRADAEPRP